MSEKTRLGPEASTRPVGNSTVGFHRACQWSDELAKLPEALADAQVARWCPWQTLSLRASVPGATGSGRDPGPLARTHSGDRG